MLNGKIVKKSKFSVGLNFFFFLFSYSEDYCFARACYVDAVYQRSFIMDFLKNFSFGISVSLIQFSLFSLPLPPSILLLNFLKVIQENIFRSTCSQLYYNSNLMSFIDFFFFLWTVCKFNSWFVNTQEMIGKVHPIKPLFILLCFFCIL